MELDFLSHLGVDSALGERSSQQVHLSGATIHHCLLPLPPPASSILELASDWVQEKNCEERHGEYEPAFESKIQASCLVVTEN